MILRKTASPRRGFSLLEVLLAFTIFLIALIGISRLTDFGGQLAVELDLRSQGALLAQSKLAEVMAGAVPLTSQSEAPFDDNEEWTWALDAEADEIPGLFRVKIVVSHETPGGGKVEVTLAQYVLDPKVRGSLESQ